MNKRKSFPIIVALLAAFPCLALAETQPTATPEPATGLEGTISVSPIQGGPQRLGVPNSRPLANTAFVVKKEGAPATSFTTDEQGWFRISLLPGHYTVSKKDREGKLGSYGPFEVDVVAGQITKVQWNCDTGMR
jgi:hypothetical protein